MKQSFEEMIEVLKAAAEGKTLQCRGRSSDEWVDLEESDYCSWDFSYYEYRAKPEPPTLYFNVYQTPSGGYWSSCYATEEEARNAATNPNGVATAIPIVIPEGELACI